MYFNHFSSSRSYDIETIEITRNIYAVIFEYGIIFAHLQASGSVTCPTYSYVYRCTEKLLKQMGLNVREFNDL